MRESDLVCFFENVAKLKIPFGIISPLTEVAVGGIGRDTWHFFFSLTMTFQQGRPLEGFFSHVDRVISHSVYFNLIPCSIT